MGVPVAHLGHMRTLMDGIPPGAMNTSMTINATAPWLLGLYVANAEEQGVHSGELRGTTQNDIVKEYLSRGTHLPARTQPPPHRRRHRLVQQACAGLEPDQRLQLPPAGGGSDARAGGGIRPGRRCRSAGRRAGIRPGPRRPLPGRRRLDLVLRQRRHPLHRGDLQAAGTGRSVGPDHARAVRGAGPQAAPAVRRPGQLARADRGAARTTSSASCWRCWPSRCPSGRGPAACSSAWNEALGLPRRGTSSGR